MTSVMMGAVGLAGGNTVLGAAGATFGLAGAGLTMMTSLFSSEPTSYQDLGKIGLSVAAMAATAGAAFQVGAQLGGPLVGAALSAGVGAVGAVVGAKLTGQLQS